ncbi:hypothetical protein MHK_007493 [Candidatus Magnetomorum sp. HK-1]|nr:hypothetical protein MHK_007493 [Candidatus Magnetomorum sp. HK-1]
MKQYVCLIIILISTNAFGTSHFIDVPNTGYSSSYSGKIFLFGHSAIDNADEVGVFIKNAGHELLIGACVFGEITSGYYYVNIYGDDPLTTDKDGASLNDTMIFKVWDADQDIEHVILWENMSFESYAPLSQPVIPPQFSGSKSFGLLNLTVNEAAPVTMYQLTINTQGSGSGSLSEESQLVSNGTSLTVVATPYNETTFMGWTGAFSGTGPAILVDIQSDITLTAIFEYTESLADTPIHFTNVKLTDQSCTYVGKVQINQMDAEDHNDELGVFYEDDTGIQHLVGSCVIGSNNEGFYLVNVYGDDSATQVKDGAANGDRLYFYLWDKSTCKEYKSSQISLTTESYQNFMIPETPPIFRINNSFGFLNLSGTDIYGAVKGKIRYTGTKTGYLNIGLSLSDCPDSNVVNDSVLWDKFTTSYDYSFDVPIGSYTLKAFIDNQPSVLLQNTYLPYTSMTNLSVSNGQTITMNDLYLSTPDLNANNLPDWWEQNYTNVGLSTNDDDHDGYSNRLEYQNRTNPFEKDAAYFFRGYSDATDTRTRMLTFVPSPCMPSASFGDAFQFQVMLQKTKDLEMAVPLQLFVHFDSSVLKFNQFNSFIGDPSGYTIKSEQESQADNDPETDRVIEIKWPHNQFQSMYIYPESICSLAYTVINLNGSIPDGIITRINFSTSKDYTCDTHSVSVKNLDFSYDIDGNGKADALTDGLLLLYYMADANQTYTNLSAINATRTETLAYLNRASKYHLDIDGNGDIDFLTDGLLILRYFFAFVGESLCHDAIGEGANRRLPKDIEAYILRFIPE